MTQSIPKQLFLMKMTLGIVIANAAGRALAGRISSSGRWDGAFISTFFPLVCILVMQWILLSDDLPAWWMIAGLLGCILSASILGAINLYISEQIFRIIIRELNIFNSTLMGILAALPQWFVLKHKRGYLWVLANGMGWLLSAACRNLLFYPQSDLWRILISETSFIPVGLSLSLYLYSYVYKANTQEMH